MLRSAWVRILLLIGLLSVSMLGIRAHAQDKAPANWTVMVYLAANNNLEPNSIFNLMELSEIGSSANLNIVAQITRPADYQGFYGEWGGTRRFLVTKSDGTVSANDFQISAPRFDAFIKRVADNGGIDPSLVDKFKNASRPEQEKFVLANTVPPIDPQAPLPALQIKSVQDLGPNVNSGDAAALTDFGTWAVQNYPAEHYALIMWDHGGGWSMIASDDALGPDGIPMPAFQASLKAITAAAGVEKLDLVAFDACLMGQVPVLATVAPFARYMVGAEELVPGFGFNYAPPMKVIADKGDATAPDIAQTEVDAFDTLYGKAVPDVAQTYDLGVFDLSRVDPLVTALNNFAEAVKANPQDALQAIGDARPNVQEFGNVGETKDVTDSISSVDLIHLMELIGKFSSDDGIKQAAAEVIDAAKAAIVYHKASATLPNANGLSIFFPKDQDTFDSAQGARYSQEFATLLPGWQSFLETFYGTATQASKEDTTTSPVKVAMQSVTPEGQVNSQKPPTITFNLDGKNIVDVTAYVMFEADAQTTITVGAFPVGNPTTDADGNPLFTYPDGPQTVSFTWDAKFSVLTDGKNALPVLMSSNADDLKTGYIDGIYTNALTGKSTDAFLVVNLDTMKVECVWGADIKGTDTLAQLTVIAGDTFEPTYEVFDAKGESKQVPAGKKLVFGGEPMSVTAAPAVNGNYTVELVVEDVAGNVNSDVVSLTVAN